MQQIEDRHQPRFSADEAPLPEIDNPVDGPLGRRREVEVDLIAVGRVILAKPGMFVRGPIVEIMGSLARKLVLPEIGPQGKKIVLQSRYELALGQGAQVRADEGLVQEADDQGGMVGIKQPPRRMLMPQRFERAIIHLSSPDAVPDVPGSELRASMRPPNPPTVSREPDAAAPAPPPSTTATRPRATRCYCSLFVLMSRSASDLCGCGMRFAVDIFDQRQNGRSGMEPILASCTNTMALAVLRLRSLIPRSRPGRS